MKAVLAALAVSAILVGAAATSLIAPSGDDTPAGAVVGPYPGVALEPLASAEPAPASPPATTPAATSLSQARTPEPTPAPLVLGAEATRAPLPLQATDAAVAPAPAPHDRCPLVPILTSPSDELAAATESAIAMREGHLGCDAFTLASGGIAVKYEPDWPGACRDPDIAACTYNGIFLSPLAPRYDPASVIAHELGHVLNFGHEIGPLVMNPANWSGPSTAFCEITARCR